MKGEEIQEKVNLQLQNKKKVQKLKEKGITLIALVVTIIILLILVGVTISQLSGENGLIRKAKEAVGRYKNASEEELIQLGQLEQYVSDFEIIGGDAVAGDILSGKTAYVKGKLVTGSMTDYSGQTLEASTITNEGDYSVLNIPKNGYYSTNTKIKALKSELQVDLSGKTPVALSRVNTATNMEIGGIYIVVYGRNQYGDSATLRSGAEILWESETAHGTDYSGSSDLLALKMYLLKVTESTLTFDGVLNAVVYVKVS